MYIVGLQCNTCIITHGMDNVGILHSPQGLHVCSTVIFTFLLAGKVRYWIKYFMQTFQNTFKITFYLKTNTVF